MTGFTVSLVMQAAMLSSGAQPYADAYHAAQANNQPLVVLVGTEWCPGCKTMKQGVMPRLFGRGKMRNVQFTQVNSDEDWNLASKLLQGNTIPQLVVFSKGADGGWQREQLTGAKTEAEVEAAIERAIEANSKTADRVTVAKPVTETK